MTQPRAVVPEEEDLAALLEELGTYDAPERGDLREGVVVAVRPGEVIVDIRAKQEAIVSPREVQAMPREEYATLHPGDGVLVYVVHPSGPDGSPVVSIERAKAQEDWLRAEELLDSGVIVTLTVTGCNRGGLLCDFGRVQGFVPASQVVRISRRRTSPDEDPLTQLIGEEIALKVIEVDRRRRRLVLSERQAVREWRAQQRQRLLSELTPGQVRRGRVSNLCDFGAFVDLGGMDGLVHISEIAWHRIKHPSEALRPGQEVEVYVLRVDPEAERVGLSIKRLKADPWVEAGERYSVGQTLTGTVTHVVRFGAFVELEPGIEGLVHVSELSEEHVSDPTEVVDEGQVVNVSVLSVDLERRQIGLRLEDVTDGLGTDVAAGAV